MPFFQRGTVNPWFWSKNGHFSNFFFRKYRLGKCFLRYSRTKNAFLSYKNKQFKREKNWHISKGVNPWFWSKNGRFFQPFFLGNIGQENVFYDILERKNASLGYKNKKFKTAKNWHFPKGLTHGFGPKLAILLCFFYIGHIGQGKVFYDICERKNAFLGFKDKTFK